MEISIVKLKKIVDELQESELLFKRQMHAFGNVLHEYQPLERDGKDKHTMRLISEDLAKEYQQIKKLKLALIQIIRSYEKAEKNVANPSGLFTVSQGFREIDTGDAQRILKGFNITLM